MEEDRYLRRGLFPFFSGLILPAFWSRFRAELLAGRKCFRKGFNASATGPGAADGKRSAFPGRC